jgi:tetratricopeptide (TPR) repeat protein
MLRIRNLLDLFFFSFLVSVTLVSHASDDSADLSKRLQEDKRDIGAYISLIKIKTNSTQFSDALSYQKKALRYARENRDILTLRALGITANAGLGKLEKAESEYKRAMKTKGALTDIDLHLAMSKTYLKFRALEKAKRTIATAIRAKPLDRQLINLLTRLLTIEKAIIVTRNNLAYAETISREQVAGLLISELQIDLFKKPGTNPDQNTTSDKGLTDYADSAFVKDILIAHALNIRSFRVQNGAFRPDADFTLQDLALLVEDILDLTDGINKTLYIGTPSPYSDLSADDTAFNAFMNSITRGVIHGSLNGEIKPDASVSGAKTLLALHRLKESLNAAILNKH